MQRIVEILWQKNAKPLIRPLWDLSKWLHKQFRFGSASNANEELDIIRLNNANHSKVVAYALMNILEIYTIPNIFACLEKPILVAITKENTAIIPRSNIAIPDNMEAFLISKELSYE